MSQFEKYSLHPSILKLLEEVGYNTPTPIQEHAIPKVLEGIDLVASAQTGTGKTAAFLLPLIHQLASRPKENAKERGPHILVLVPTRELALQISTEAKKFCKYLPFLKTACIFGGMPYPLQKKSLAAHPDILVATPGRLIDLMRGGFAVLSRVKTLVLDEADRMLDRNFLEPVEKIVSALPKRHQTLLFSATLDQSIMNLSKQLQHHPEKIELAKDIKASIEQRLYYVDNFGHKLRLLEHLLENTEITQSIIFTSRISQANELADYLLDKGYESDALHGDMSQNARIRTINKLRKGQIRFLVATDVAARGIDISTLSHVVNFDFPYQPEDFIHRIGRTGRAGAKGFAITFAMHKEKRWVDKVNQLLENPLEAFTIEGLEPKPAPKEGSKKGPFRGGRFGAKRERGSGRGSGGGHGGGSRFSRHGRGASGDGQKRKLRPPR